MKSTEYGHRRPDPISSLIATPLAWYFLDGWLQKYEYRPELSWWLFAAAGAGALRLRWPQ